MHMLLTIQLKLWDQTNCWANLKFNNAEFLEDMWCRVGINWEKIDQVVQTASKVSVIDRLQD